MKQQSLITLIFLLLISLILGACDSSGSTTGTSSSCRASGTSGSCTITIRTLKGTTFQKVENESFRQGTGQVVVTVRASAASGGLKVFFEDKDGKQTSAEVQPGQTVELKGAAQVFGTNPRYFTINLQALDEQATDISAEVSYQAE